MVFSLLAGRLKFHSRLRSKEERLQKEVTGAQRRDTKFKKERKKERAPVVLGRAVCSAASSQAGGVGPLTRSRGCVLARRLGHYILSTDQARVRGRMILPELPRLR